VAAVQVGVVEVPRPVVVRSERAGEVVVERAAGGDDRVDVAIPHQLGEDPPGPGRDDVRREGEKGGHLPVGQDAGQEVRSLGDPLRAEPAAGLEAPDETVERGSVIDASVLDPAGHGGPEPRRVKAPP